MKFIYKISFCLLITLGSFNNSSSAGRKQSNCQHALASWQASALSSQLFRLPSGEVKEVIYENQQGFAITESDIILNATQPSKKGFHASTLPNLKGKLWPNGLVPYQVAEHLPEFQKKSVQQAMQLWEDNAGIFFIELTKETRIFYADYLYIQPINGITCASAVGKQGGQQSILLSVNCNTMNIVHELGHAIGLWHEQSRKDRDQYIRIVWDAIKDGYKYNFNQHLNDGVDQGAYNYESIMHYSAYAFSKNGQKTIIPLKDGVIIGQRNYLSEGDIAAVKALYTERIPNNL